MKSHTALVSGFARSFISGQPIPDATISVLENKDLTFKTDSAGKFGPIEWPVGEPITLIFEKPGSFWSGYKTTQTATFIVPPEGINDNNYLKNISFQVPSNMAYKLLSFAMGGTEDSEACQVAATVTPPNTTMDDIPQGIEGVTVTLSPNVKPRTFYFGMFPIIHKTNPFIRSLKKTSLDGGVAFINVPPGDYVMEATKDDIQFSKVLIKARKGVIVNASPPNGPTMIKEPKLNEAEKTKSHFSFFKPALTIGLVTSVCIAGAVLNKSCSYSGQ
ncbi:carboxypeptidase regulatory-like domain-containing protein [Legionella cardiaca]|uniref:Carboxypeptidase regulatory-like domain-containing protein n=1 Tax=Legionella cardiaca TaxID=1071983 RepID=A0ABY8AT00_9GAMM|nr:carboxypeptidase regulatory-like domain-containing protein [Legionella cardiaca]WED42292.1 carboxypeptidase regulatory-like domain-containing protein [Legionella cardiaca]